MGLVVALALEKRGAQVLVIGRNPDSCSKAQQQLSNNSLVLRGDATDEETIDKAIKMAHAKLGVISGLFHVAGGS